MPSVDPSPHAIHLGTAWEAPAPHSDGGTVWRRRFGRPAGLTPSDRVLLVVADRGMQAGVAVNGVWLPPLQPGTGRWEQDVTSLLRDRNELQIVVAARPSDGLQAGPHRWLLPAEVGRLTLEIVATAYPPTAGPDGDAPRHDGDA